MGVNSNTHDEQAVWGKESILIDAQYVLGSKYSSPKLFWSGKGKGRAKQGQQGEDAK